MPCIFATTATQAFRTFTKPHHATKWGQLQRSAGSSRVNMLQKHTLAPQSRPTRSVEQSWNGHRANPRPTRHGRDSCAANRHAQTPTSTRSSEKAWKHKAKPAQISTSTRNFEQPWQSHKAKPTPAPSGDTFDIVTVSPLAQTSRAARQAVLLALETPIDGIQNALHIVNSLHHPFLKENPEASNLPNVASYIPMTFNQKVNPRLASHALVHGLIRRNQLKDAAHLAVSMMQYGMRVHTRTLDAVMNTLEPNYFSKKSSVKSTMPPNFIPNPKSLGDLAPMAQHATSRLALEIFTVARKTGQGDTRGLFATLLAICLLNAEIVLACLVFGTTIKEFYHPPPCPEGDTASTTWNADKYGPRSLLFLPTWGHLNYILAPMTDYFRYVVTLRTTSPEFEQSALDANLQALAILANLLDFRQLHLSTISSLLALMYSTPRVDAEVWVMDKGGNNRQVVAFAYFHDVLVRLIESPPGSRTSSNKKSTRAFTPPLGLKSSNTLLHYALRHCQSPDLGNKVIVHLTEARKLALDQTTYNILLRSGTLMRDNDLASLAVTAVASKSPPSKSLSKHSSKDPPRNHRPSKRPDLHENTPLRALALSEHEAVRSIASTIETLQSVELWMMSRNRQARIDTAVYNLTTHLMHLTSTGQPHVAITVIFALFPALQVCTSLKEQVRIRRKEVVRASRYGPITFTVLLHALVKAKAFLEARLFYTFACKAERRSWFTPAPWAFGPEFYTVMLELCTAECVEASRLESRASSAVEKAAVKTMRLRTLRMALRQYLRINKVPFEAHYTMENSGHSEHIHKLVFPKRDERLSTALIEVLVQHFKYADPASLPVPDIATGSNHPPHALTGTSAESVARTFDDTERDFIERGVLPRGWSPALQFIARGIIQAGMEIPPALRHLFLGRYDAAARPRGRGVSLRVVPWAYSTEGTEAQNPWRVPSLRTRGLARPTRRRNRTSRSRTF